MGSIKKPDSFREARFSAIYKPVVKHLFFYLSLLATTLTTDLVTAGAASQSSNKQTVTFALLTQYKMPNAQDRLYQITEPDMDGLGDAAGVVYSHMGLMEHPDDTGNTDLFPAFDEQAYNNAIFAAARNKNKQIWLHVTPIHNRTSHTRLDEQTQQYVTSVENLKIKDILYGTKSTRQQFLDNFRASTAGYLDAFADSDCHINLFDEETPFHSRLGGGEFWYRGDWPFGGAGSVPPVDRDDIQNNFYKDFGTLFAMLKEEIHKVNPDCQVGFHIGHSPTYLRQFPSSQHPEGQTLLDLAIEKMARRGQAPDFIIYDLYIKAQTDFDTFRKTLIKRKALLDEAVANVPVKGSTNGEVHNIHLYHLAQLHTLNNFQHGAGRTASKEQLRYNMYLVAGLDFDGFGYYTKNPQQTWHLQDDLPIDATSSTLTNSQQGSACMRNPRDEAIDTDVTKWIRKGKRVWHHPDTNIWLNFSCATSEDAAPYDPNELVRMSVFESSPERWRFGLRMLNRFKTIDRSHAASWMCDGNESCETLLQNSQ